MRRIAKTDANQRELVSALRRIGAKVLSLHQVGKGCPDLLVGYRGHNFLLEVKAKGGRITNDQTEFLATWSGQADVVWSVEEAVNTIIQRAK